MRRRVSAAPVRVDGTPDRLFRFDAADWDCAPDAVWRWYAARTEWFERTGESAEHDDTQPWPDAPFDPDLI